MGKDKKEKKEKKEKSKREEKDRRKRSRKERDHSPGPASAPHTRRSTSSPRHASLRPVQVSSKDEGYSPSRQRRVEAPKERSPAVPAVPPVRYRESAFTREASPPQREPLEERLVHVEQHQAGGSVQSPPKHIRTAGDLPQYRDGQQRGLPAKEQQPPHGRHQQDTQVRKESVQQPAPRRLRPAGDFAFVKSSLHSIIRPPGLEPGRHKEAARHAQPRHMPEVSAQLARRLARPVQAPPQNVLPSSRPRRLPSSTPAMTESRSASPPPSKPERASHGPITAPRNVIAAGREGHVPGGEPAEKAVAPSAALEGPMSQFSEQITLLRSQVAEKQRALASLSVGSQGLEVQPSQQRPANRDSLRQMSGANAGSQRRKRSASPAPAVPEATRPAKAARATSTATPVLAQAGRARPMPIPEQPSARSRSLMFADRLGVDEDARGVQASLKTEGLPSTSRVPVPPPARAVSTEPPRQAPAPARHPPAFGIKSLEEIRKEKAAKSASPARSGAALPAPSVTERVRARARVLTPSSQAPSAPQPVAESGLKRKRPPIQFVPPATDSSVPTAGPPGLMRALSGDLPDGKRLAPGGRVAAPAPTSAPAVVPVTSSHREQRPPGDKTLGVSKTQPQPQGLEGASNGRLRARIPIPPPSKGPHTVPSVGPTGPSTVPASRAAVPVPNHLQRPAAPEGPIPQTPSPTPGVPALPSSFSLRKTEAAQAKPVREMPATAGPPGLDTHLAAAGKVADGTETKLGASEGRAKLPVDANGASAGGEASGTSQAGGGSTGGLQPRFARKLPPVKKVEEPPVPYEHKSMTVMKGGDALEIRYYMHVPTGATERLRLRRLRQEAEDRARAEQALQASAVATPASNGIANEDTAPAVENGTASVPEGVAVGHTVPAVENGTAPGLEGFSEQHRGTAAENGTALGPDGAADGGAPSAAQDPAGVAASGASEGEPEGRADGDGQGVGDEKAEADANERPSGGVVHHLAPVVAPT